MTYFYLFLKVQGLPPGIQQIQVQQGANGQQQILTGSAGQMQTVQITPQGNIVAVPQAQQVD